MNWGVDTGSLVGHILLRRMWQFDTGSKQVREPREFFGGACVGRSTSEPVGSPCRILPMPRAMPLQRAFGVLLLARRFCGGGVPGGRRGLIAHPLGQWLPLPAKIASLATGQSPPPQSRCCARSRHDTRAMPRTWGTGRRCESRFEHRHHRTRAPQGACLAANPRLPANDSSKADEGW